MAQSTPKPTTDILPTPPEHLRGLPILSGGEDLVARTLSRILDAESPEQVLANPDAVGVRNLSGSVVVLTDVIGIMPSSIREGGWYVVLEAVHERTGEMITMTSGGVYVVAAAVKMKRSGWLPRRVRILELDSASSPGQSSLWLVDAPADVEQVAQRVARQKAAEYAHAGPADTTPTVAGEGEDAAF